MTPVYNAEEFLSDTIDSVLGQTFTNWEHILVNDASTDGSLNLLKSYAEKDDRIQVINLAENSGAAVAATPD